MTNLSALICNSTEQEEEEGEEREEGEGGGEEEDAIIIMVFINNPNQLNMFRAMILKSSRLCLQLVV